jgi:hypothetical protein
VSKLQRKAARKDARTFRRRSQVLSADCGGDREEPAMPPRSRAGRTSEKSGFREAMRPRPSPAVGDAVGKRRIEREQAESPGVRVQGGQMLLTDGPFVDATEHVGGYDLVEADELAPGPLLLHARSGLGGAQLTQHGKHAAVAPGATLGDRA